MDLRFWLSAIFSALLALPAAAQPTATHVTLAEFTRLSLEVVPDFGTELVFPFVLDDGQTPALEIHNTNDTGFAVDHTAGHNTIVVTVKTPAEGGPVPDYRGLLFINVGGYHLSIELRAVSHVSKNVAQVVFDLAPDAREYLLTEAVKRKTAQLDADFQSRVAALDGQAEARALNLVAELALSHPKTVRVKSAAETTMGAGEAVDLFADEWKRYPSFAVLVFDVTNKSAQRLAVRNAQIQAIGEQDRSKVSDSTFQCDGPLKADTRIHCTLTTRDTPIAEAERLKLVLTTDRGIAELTW